MKTPKYTDSQVSEIKSVVLNYNKAKNFMSCPECTDEFLAGPLKDVMTPKEYGMYEVSSYTFTYPGGEKRDIVSVWCKRCGKSIWDSREMSQSL